MCINGVAIDALLYLQTSLAAVVDHHNEAEASLFRGCMASLLAPPAAANLSEQGMQLDDRSVSRRTEEQRRRTRLGVYRALLPFFDEQDTMPKPQLLDLLISYT